MIPLLERFRLRTPSTKRQISCERTTEEEVKRLVLFLATLLPLVAVARPDSTEPLRLLQAVVMPDVPKGPYSDHLAVDLQSHRLFATPQAQKSVQVIDFITGKLLHTISGIGNPHSVLYRQDLDQIYVTDGEAGLLRIYSGKDYKQINSIDQLPDADSIGYDPATKYLYVTNGGRAAGMDSSRLSVIDTTRAKRLGDIKLPAQSPEAMAMESSGSKIYVDLMDQNKVAVVDRDKRELVATWPVTKCKKNIAAGLDEANHRLFIGCRDTETTGTLDVIDTESGKELEVYPLGGWVDYIVFDATAGRIYASCGAPVAGGGAIYVFQSNGQGHYTLLSKTPTAPRAKTALFVPELKRLFVSVPHFEEEARILFFQVE
jgi:DNA-binding beta-propeller fold protein YncE